MRRPKDKRHRPADKAAEERDGVEAAVARERRAAEDEERDR